MNNDMEKENKDYMDKDGARERRGGAKKPYRKKVCEFCKEGVAAPDYKDPDKLRRYTSERGKILSGKFTGACAKHQRALTREIKRARTLAYLPFERK